MPLMIVWPDSWSVETRNEGSSAARRLSAMPMRSWSALVFGSTDSSMTGSGNSIRSRMIGALVAQSRSEEHTSELQSLMRISYAVFCLNKKTKKSNTLVDHEQQQVNC